MRCLVGVMAFAVLVLGGAQASWAASLVLPTICTIKGDGTCAVGGPDVDGGIGDGTPGLDESFDSLSPGSPATTVREHIHAWGGPDRNRPLTVTVDGGAFDVATDTISLSTDEMVTVVVKVRNFVREWTNVTGAPIFGEVDGPVPAFFSGAVGAQIGFLDYQDAQNGYTIPLNIALVGGADGVQVDGVSATLVSQAEEIVVDSSIGGEGVIAVEDFSTQAAASFNVELQDGDMNVLDTSGQDQFGSGGVSINSFVQNELLMASGVTELALIIEDLDALAPSSFDLEIKLTGLAPNPVPLPAAAWLFLSGIGALMGFRGLRKKA